MSSKCYLSECTKYVDEDIDYKPILRYFINNKLSVLEQDYHEDVSSLLINKINTDENKEVIYKYIYYGTIEPIIKNINSKEYEKAYGIYKMNLLSLENMYLDKEKTR